MTARDLIYYLIQVLTLAIIVRSLMSWFPNALHSPVGRFILQATEPVLSPLRRILPTIGMIDITPMVAVIVLQIVAAAVHSA